jgi:S1-C subfamily serine protease
MKSSPSKGSPLSLEELLTLGEIGLEQGYWQQAESYFAQALAIAPDDPRGLWGRARATREAESVKTTLDSLLEIEPNHPGGLAMRRRMDHDAAQQAEPKPASDATPQSLPHRAALITSGHASMPKTKRAWHSYTLPTALLVLSVMVLIVMLLGGRILWEQHLPTTKATVTTPIEPLSAPESAPTLAHTASTLPISTLQRAQLATVLILAPDDGGDLVRGSGTLVTPCGLVLTNHHVVGHVRQSAMPPELPLAFIGLAQDVRRSPSLWYLAVTVATDPRRDLAILRIVARAETGRPMDTQRFETVAIGDSSALELGQGIIGIGYPALGGETLTLTRGSMAGFADRDGVAFGKTDSELLPGSSGGAVLDDEGGLIGVITAAHVDERTQGRLSYFVLIEQAAALMEQAIAEPAPHANLHWAVTRFREVARID